MVTHPGSGLPVRKRAFIQVLQRFSRLTQIHQLEESRGQYRHDRWLQPLPLSPVLPDYPQITGNLNKNLDACHTLKSPLPSFQGESLTRPLLHPVSALRGGWWIDSDAIHTAPLQFLSLHEDFHWPIRLGQPMKKQHRCLAKCLVNRPQALPHLAVSYLPEQERPA